METEDTAGVDDDWGERNKKTDESNLKEMLMSSHVSNSWDDKATFCWLLAHIN